MGGWGVQEIATYRLIMNKGIKLILKENTTLDVYFSDGKVKRYSVRDKFVLACLDEKDYPEVGPLADVFRKAIISYQNKNENIKGNVL